MEMSYVDSKVHHLKLLTVLYFFGYKTGFSLSRMTKITKSVLCNFAIIRLLPLLNNPKNLDPSYKMDLDFWIVLEEKNSVL